MTDHYGTYECKAFRESYFRQYEPICLTLAKGYSTIAAQQGYVEANRRFLKLNNELLIADFNVSLDPDRLTSFAKNKAKNCAEYIGRLAETDALRAYRQLAEPYNFKLPTEETFGAIRPCL